MAALKAEYLVDKSALSRFIHPAVRERLAPIIEDGRAATCAVIELEVLYSARNHQALVATRWDRRLAYERIPLSEATFERALDVQAELARTAQHRLPIPDLIIAAAAEQAGLIVLHYDGDYDRIAAVTGQVVEWVVPRGSVP